MTRPATPVSPRGAESSKPILMRSLEGKHALITGSTSGIGLGIAHALAELGATIALNGFGEPDTIAQLQRDIERQHGVRTLHIDVDVSDGDACRGLVERAVAAFGKIDILINNAGIQYIAPVEEFPSDRWNAILAVNLSAAFHLIAAALPGMKRRGYGRIINVASAHGLVGSANKAAYVASKHGLVGLTKTVALETADTGVTCNAICPGWVLTPLVESQIERRMESAGMSAHEVAEQMLSEKQPSRKFTRPEEVGAVAAFLCSKVAGNLTGASISIDGGWTAQ